MTCLSRETLAKICRCEVKTISRAGLPKKKGRVFDIDDAEVWRFVQKKIAEWEKKAGIAPVTDRGAIESLKKFADMEELSRLSDLENPDDLESLDDKKKWEEILVLKARKIKLITDIEERKSALVPTELVLRWFGYLASGISNNFLSLGQSVSRGDKTLRDRIEKMVGRAVRKTVGDAEDRVKKDQAELATRAREREEAQEREKGGTNEAAGEGKKG